MLSCDRPRNPPTPRGRLLKCKCLKTTSTFPYPMPNSISNLIQNSNVLDRMLAAILQALVQIESTIAAQFAFVTAVTDYH